MIGTGLMAMPTANGRISPITEPMHPPAERQRPVRSFSQIPGDWAN
jgi:hypothetical protein